MSSAAAGWLQVGLLVAALAACYSAAGSRAAGQPGRLAGMGEEAFTALVRGAVGDWGACKAWGPCSPSSRIASPLSAGGPQPSVEQMC